MKRFRRMAKTVRRSAFTKNKKETFTLLFLLLAGGLFLFQNGFGGIFSAKGSHGTTVLGIQMSDGGSNTAGGQAFTPAPFIGSGWASDSNSYDPDNARVYISNFSSWDSDFRFGIRLSDGFNHGGGCGDQTGATAYTPWASDGGGWSSWASDVGAYDPNCAEVFVETQPFPNNRYVIADAQAGIRASDHGCGSQTGPIATTPWARQGGGWSSYVSDGNNYDPDCFQIFLDAKIVELGDIQVTAQKAGGAPAAAPNPLAMWNIKDAEGKIVAQESTGSAGATYSGILPGTYTIEPIQTFTSGIYTYTLTGISPSPTQTLGIGGSCGAGDVDPHPACVNSSCVAVPGCGPSDCSDCIDPVGDATPFTQQQLPALKIENTFSGIFPSLIRVAEARPIGDTEFSRPPDEPAGAFECISGRCDFVPGSTSANVCLEHRDCDPSYVPPPTPQPPLPPPPPQITYALTYTVTSAAGVSCSPLSQTVGVGQQARFDASGGDGSFSWTSTPGGTASSYTGTTLRISYSSAGPKQVVVRSAGQTSAPCTVTVTDRFPLVITDTPGGPSCTVTSVPAGINCVDGGNDCSESYNQGAVVTLSGVGNNAQSRFDGLTGDADCSDRSVTMNAPKSCMVVCTDTSEVDPMPRGIQFKPSDEFCTVHGWTNDLSHSPPGQNWKDLTVFVYVDGNTTPVVTTIANLPFAVPDPMCPDNSCRFNVSLDGLISKGISHNVSTYAVNVNSSGAEIGPEWLIEAGIEGPWNGGPTALADDITCPVTQGTVTVTSRNNTGAPFPTGWTLTTPTVQFLEGSISDKTYSNQPGGIYTITPASVAGYSATVSQCSPSATCSQSITAATKDIRFDIVYTPVPNGSSCAVDILADGSDGPTYAVPPFNNRVRLTWTSTNVAPGLNCVATNDWALAGSQPERNTFGYDVFNVDRTRTYGISCIAAGGGSSCGDSVMVTISAPPQTESFYVEPQTNTVTQGQSVCYFAMMDPDGSGPLFGYRVTATWSTNNSSVARDRGVGFCTGGREFSGGSQGSATITARYVPPFSPFREYTADATLAVNPLPPEDFTVLLTASPNPLEVGISTRFRAWAMWSAYYPGSNNWLTFRYWWDCPNYDPNLVIGGITQSASQQCGSLTNPGYRAEQYYLDVNGFRVTTDPGTGPVCAENATGLWCEGYSSAERINFADHVYSTPGSKYAVVAASYMGSGDTDTETVVVTNEDQTLTVQKTGAGVGTVTSDDGSINCNPSCNSAQATYSYGLTSMLSQQAGSNSVFAGWTGCELVGPGGECGVVMDADETVTAQFDLLPTLTASLAASPSSGLRPLSVQLTPTVGGTAAGTKNFSFWWDCNYSDASPTVQEARSACGAALTVPASGSCVETPGVGYKCDGVANDPSATVTYSTASTKRAIVVVERDGASPALASANVTVTSPTDLSVSLSANPSSGPAPLTTELAADVSGTQTGNISYHMWFHCPTYTGGASVAGASATCGSLLAPSSGACRTTTVNGVELGVRCDNVTTDPLRRSHTYSNAGIYRPIVVVTRGLLVDFDDASVIADISGTHFECRNNACTSVDGAGSNFAGCLVEGARCGVPSTCTFTADPSVIFRGESTTLSWSCGALNTSCEVEDEEGNTVASGGRVGSGEDSPTETTDYTLRCDQETSVKTVTVRVTTRTEVPPR